ncbi:OsmC family protein [Fundicoccus culcitae]|uniref:OsmC family protein n=1 Tax=Fundicoccus culcitae TaxID=2969821 RepID=A0ABY5P8N3_9LACT|nr:OsmC family protein [Fundicoccus culcitae]UUX34723.1 OsmC family protein [Fundicoccus culcitae]
MSDSIQFTWAGGSKGKGQIDFGTYSVDIAIPEALRGSGEGFGPKELLASAAQACFGTTLVYALEARKIETTDVSVTTEITTNETGLLFIHHIKVLTPTDLTDEVERAIAYSDRKCDVGNLLKSAGVTINVESEILVG